MRHLRRLSCLFVLAVVIAAPPAPAAAPSAPVEISVYAAASLRDALQAAAPQLESALGTRPIFNFGSSSDLAHQIVAAAKADVFLSADEAWMDTVEKEGLVDGGSRRSFLSNRLVVIAPLDGSLKIGAAADLGAAGVRHLSLANPEAVPAGRYARAWLEKAGAWGSVRGKVVPAVDVRAALAAVESGAAEAGIVYRTDAMISRKVRVIYEVPDSETPPISYSIAALASRPNLVLSRRVVEWLAGPEGGRTFARFGFVVPNPAP